jgi:hypothetical protein
VGKLEFNNGVIMKPISREVVEKTWQEMAEMNLEDGLKAIEKLGKEQPAVLAYLMAAGGDIFTEEDRELMLYLGMVVWKIMSQGDKPLKEVSISELESEEEAHLKMLDDLANQSVGDVTAFTANMLNNFNQIEVFKYVVEAIMMDEDFDEEDLYMGDNGSDMEVDDFVYDEDELDDFDDEDFEDMDFDEEDIELDDEARGMMLICLQTVIKCFDKS